MVGMNNYGEISKKFLLEDEQIDIDKVWNKDKGVIILEFTNGKEIVFKPIQDRNVEFIKGISAIFFGKEYSNFYDSLTTDEGTWVRYTVHKPISSLAEAKQFYFNYGKLIYMAYILGMNNLNQEKIVANGVYPVITDVETIFSSYIIFNSLKAEFDAQYKASKKLLYSAMSTGLVPISPINNLNPLDYKIDILQGFNEADEIFRENRQKIYKYIESNFGKVESKISGSVCGNTDTSVERIMAKNSFDMADVKDIIEYQTADNTIVEQKNLIDNAIITSKVLSSNHIEISDKDKIKSMSTTEDMLRESIDKKIILGKDNTIAWLGLMVSDNNQLEYAMADWSIYSGISGIGIMYYTEWLNTGDRNAVAVMQLIVNTMKKEYDAGKFDAYDISYFYGLTGLYSFIKKVESVPGIELFGLKESIENLIEKNIVFTNCYDFSSGIHSAVLYYYGDYKENYFSRNIITAITYHFMENFNMRIMDASFAFASFAHGYTGLITSLLCMNRVVKDDRFSIIIKKAWEKENNLKTSDFNWIDKRSEEGRSCHYWCHGSCGIMLARLFWYKEEFLMDIELGYTEEELLSDLREYKETIEAGKIDTNNYSLSHGNFALIDYLISFERLTGERMNKKYIDKIFDKARVDGYSCNDSPGAINSIGHMVGETGIKYLINRYENNNIKSILACENL